MAVRLLGLHLENPLSVEGLAAVGKTALAKALDTMLEVLSLIILEDYRR
ncbi:MAG: hypothetical protein OSB38_31705 [Paraburkholderia fungorum]|nr:hypothetical protein [Paraburkholderia fungorum]